MIRLVDLLPCSSWLAPPDGSDASLRVSYVQIAILQFSVFFFTSPRFLESWWYNTANYSTPIVAHTHRYLLWLTVTPKAFASFVVSTPINPQGKSLDGILFSTHEVVRPTTSNYVCNAPAPVINSMRVTEIEISCSVTNTTEWIRNDTFYKRW